MSVRPHLGVAVVQGAVYVPSGLWPVAHIRSFEAVTGPKTDRWLVKTVGLLTAVIGGTLLDATARGRRDAGVALLGAGSAASLAAIDVWYASRGRIRRVYLLDAAMQLAFVVGWLASARLVNGTLARAVD